MKQAISVLVAVLVGIALAYAVFTFGGFGVPPEQRAATRLTSPDASTRGEAIGRWSAESTNSKTPALFLDSKVVDALRPALVEAPDVALRDLGDAFGERREWGERFPEAHMRYLELLAKDPSQEAGARALRLTRQLDDLGSKAAALEALASHADPAVRLSALEHAAHYLGGNSEPIVMMLIDDENPSVARAAWLQLAVFKPSSGLTARWREAPTPVREAMLYAVARVDPGQIDALLEEIEDNALLRSELGDVPFLLRYLADANPPEQFVPGRGMDEQLRDLAEDARRARWLHSGQHFDTLRIPGEGAGEGEAPSQ